MEEKRKTEVQGASAWFLALPGFDALMCWNAVSGEHKDHPPPESSGQDIPKRYGYNYTAYKHELQGGHIFLREDKFVVDGESSNSFTLRREAHFIEGDLCK